MNSLEFVSDDKSKKITVMRTFESDKNKVWQAWTTQDLLEQWWAPAPWKTVTKSLDFRNGGSWHYSMVGPEGDVTWSLVEYVMISPEDRFTATDYFSDEEKNKSAEYGAMHWDNEFVEDGDTTTVTATITFDSIEYMKKVMEMGFKEGFSQGLDQLEALLKEV